MRRQQRLLVRLTHAEPALLSDRPWRLNATAQAIALPGNTSALATTRSPATACGGAYVGSSVAPGMYGGMRLSWNRNQAADHARTVAASATYTGAARTRSRFRCANSAAAQPTAAGKIQKPARRTRLGRRSGMAMTLARAV